MGAAIATQDRNREVNLTREEKLAKLDALHAALTRQTATDSMDVFNKKGELATGLMGNRGNLADINLEKHPPFANATEDPASVEDAYKQIYLDGLKNPAKYAGAEGQRLFNTAADAVKAGVTKTNSMLLSNMDIPQVQTNSQGVPDPTSQEDFLSTLPPGTASLIKKIANYEMDISKVTSLRGGEREQIAALVSAYDPSFDMTQYGARAAMKKSITSGGYSQTLNASNLVLQHVDAMTDAFKELNNTRFEWYNAIANPSAKAAGDKKMQHALGKFDSDADAVASELAKVFKGVGATDVRSIEEWRRRLNSNTTPEEFKASVDTIIKDLLKSRIDTVKSQYQSAMGKPADFKFLTPHSKEILEKNGIDVNEFEVSQNANPAEQGGYGRAPAQLSSDPKKAEQEYGTLPSGAEFIGPDGVHRKKP